MAFELEMNLSKRSIADRVKSLNLYGIARVGGALRNGMKPRRHQIYCVQKAARWLAKAGDADRGKVIYLPTGGGKTVVAGALFDYLREISALRFGFYTPTLDLMVQTAERMKDFGFLVHVYHRDYDGFEVSEEAEVVLSIHNTLGNRLGEGDGRGLADVMVIDECHQTRYQGFFERMIKRGLVLGLSATPWEPRLLHFWERELLIGASHAKLQRDGVLSEAMLYGITDFDPSEQWVYKDAEEAERSRSMLGETELGSEVFDRAMRQMPDALRSHGLDEGNRFLIKCANIERGLKMAEALAEEGIESQAFNSDLGDGGTTKPQLDAIFSREEGTPPVAIVVHQFSIGYDHPRIDGVVFTNNTKFQVFVQVAGRALRVGVAGEGKRIIDLAANVAIHGNRFDRLINDPPPNISRPREKADEEDGYKIECRRGPRTLEEKELNRVNLTPPKYLLVYMVGQNGEMEMVRLKKQIILSIVCRAVAEGLKALDPKADKSEPEWVYKAQALAQKVFKSLTSEAQVDDDPVDLENKMGSRFRGDPHSMSLFRGSRAMNENEGMVFSEAMRLVDNDMG